MTLPRPIMISLRELCLWNVKMGVPQTKTFLNIAFTLKKVLKYWPDVWQGIVSFSWAGASLLSLVWESPRDGVLIKILIPITMLCYPIDLMKYQFDSWWSIVLISWAGKSLFKLDCQSPRDGVSIKIMVLITILGCLEDLLKYQFDSWWGVVLTSWSIELLFSLGWESPRDGVSMKIMVPMTMLDYLRDLLKYYFDSWWSIVFISWAGELLFKPDWQSPRDSVSIEILVPITILGWLQKGHHVIKFCHIWMYEMTKSIDKPNCVNWMGTFWSEDFVHSRTSVRCSPSLESKFVDLRVRSGNVGVRRSRSGEVER